MTKYVGLDVSQKTMVLCIVDGEGHRLWRGECISSPDQIVHTRVLKTFGMLPGSVRGRSFAERVELLVAERLDVAPIVRSMLVAWSKLREQIAAFDKAIRAEVKQSRECRLLMSVPGIGPVTVLAYVSAIERPDRFRRSRLVGAHLGLTPRQYQSGDVALVGCSHVFGL
jgi:transposase